MKHDYRNLSLISALVVLALTLNFVNGPAVAADKDQPTASEVAGPYLYEKYVIAGRVMERVYDSDTGNVCYKWHGDPTVCVPAKFTGSLSDRYEGKDAQ
jgi:hypothetical protein